MAQRTTGAAGGRGSSRSRRASGGSGGGGTGYSINRDDVAQAQAGRRAVVQYLHEAHATELALVTTLRAHIAMTPASSYRSLLERHLDETQKQAQAIQRRLGELGAGGNLIQAGIGAMQSVIGQILVLSKGQIDLLRGNAPEEKLLKNAKDECATEALEIATYDSIERAAEAVGDDGTAKLARRHRAQEERMLSELREEIPRLTDNTLKSVVEGRSTFDVSTTGAAQAAQQMAESMRGTARAVTRRVRRGAEEAQDEASETARDVRDRAQEAAGQAREAAGEAAGETRARAGRAARSTRAAGTRAATRTRETAKRARQVPGVERAEGDARGAVANASDLPIENYDRLGAGEIVTRLTELTQVQLGVVEGYERRHKARKGVLDRITALRGDEPFPGYDDLTVDQVVERVRSGDEQTAQRIRDYEQKHRKRTGIIAATQRQQSPTT